MCIRSAFQTALILSAFAVVVQGQQQDLRPGIAVMALQNGGSYGQPAEDLEALRFGLQASLLTELGVNSALRIVERSQLREILEELGLSRDSLVAPQTAAKVGRLVGARYMVLGSFMVLSHDFHLNARVVDTETGEVLVTKRVHDKDDKIYELVVDLAGQLTDAVDLPPLPKEVREQRSSRDIPTEALVLHARAVWFEERGLKEQAVQLYQRLVREFPQMTEAAAELRQLTSG